MSLGTVHYELFVRRTPHAPWTLDCAGEDRDSMIRLADETLSQGRVAAVRLCKERLDPETGSFTSATVFTKGVVTLEKRRKERSRADAPLCVSPSDLYTKHARERISRLLEGWLARKKVTAFELLHRPDLVEQLDASGVEIQHAVQKIAVPEAQARGVGVHEIIRGFQKLIERTVSKVIQDGRKGAFPKLTPHGFLGVVEKLGEHPERGYLLGGAIAAYLASAAAPREKIKRLLDLADAAAPEGPSRSLALQVLEQPLAELLGAQGCLADLLGEELDLGARLAAMTRLAAGGAVTALEPFDPSIARCIPPLAGEALRLQRWLDGEAFQDTRSATARRVLKELTGPRRLKPGDPEAEIALLRALAMALTAASGKLLPADDVHAAFIERSRTLMTGEFVEAFLANCQGNALAEAQALVRLAENVVGAANKRTAGRWLASRVSALKFETELRAGRESPIARLAALAELQRAVDRSGMQDAERTPVVGRLGEVGGWVENDARLVAQVGRATVPLQQRLALLIKLASGETAPLGPAADRARAEALKLAKGPEGRAALAGQPDMLERVRAMAQGEAA